MRRRRGLTLLEILIVLALLIASAAIAIPAMSRRFENTRFEATVDQIVATLALARAESQQQRRPVQVIWDAGARSVRAAWLDTDAIAEEAEAEESPHDPGEASSPPAQEDGERRGQDRLNTAAAAAGTMAMGGSRLRVLLPEGCRVEAPTLPPPDDAAAEWPEGERGEIAPDGASGQVLSLVVFMPDGSTFGEASFVVVDQGGRQVRIDINPWTGQAAIAPVAIAPAEDQPADAPLTGEESEP